VEHASPEEPVVLDVIADLPAGSSAHPLVARGQAARIMTGAPFPQGADTIVPVELTDAGTEKVMITGVKCLGAHVRIAGEDMTSGCHTRLRPRSSRVRSLLASDRANGRVRTGSAFPREVRTVRAQLARSSRQLRWNKP